MGFNSFLSRKTEAMSHSWLMSNTAIQYYSGICGAMSGVFFILAFIVANFIPPPKPSWDAEQISQFYQDNTTRIRAGAAILMIAGGFYLPFSAAISYQISRIPRVPYIIHQVQLASAAAGIWTYMLPGIVLAIGSFRTDRPAEITYMLNDFFWLVALMPWPTFMVQNFAFVYAIIVDSRKKPLFPKELIIVNIIMPILFAFATGIHTHYDGPLAYDGIVAFYIIGFSFVVQLAVDGIYLCLAARDEERSGGVYEEKDERIPERSLESSLEAGLPHVEERK